MHPKVKAVGIVGVVLSLAAVGATLGDVFGGAHWAVAVATVCTAVLTFAGGYVKTDTTAVPAGEPTAPVDPTPPAGSDGDDSTVPAA